MAEIEDVFVIGKGVDGAVQKAPAEFAGFITPEFRGAEREVKAADEEPVKPKRARKPKAEPETETEVTE